MKLILDERRQEAPDVTSFYFKPQKPFAWKAGQFLHYTLPHPDMDDRKDDRYFTIAAPPHEGRVRITTRFSEKSSSFKKALKALPLDAAIEAEGPEGEFTVDDSSRQMIFIAGGIGVTPYRAILLDLDYRKQPMAVTLLYANRTEDAVYRKELEGLSAKHPDLKIRWFIGKDLITPEAIKEAASGFKKPLYYISGPEPMVQAFEKTLAGIGIAKEDVRTDFFPGYSAI